MRRLSNTHPGEVLLEEFLLPMDISQNAPARAAGVPPRRINEIVLGKRGISADTAVRAFLARAAANHDLEEANPQSGAISRPSIVWRPKVRQRSSRENEPGPLR